MLKPLLASALFAGLIAGLFAAGLQLAYLVPLISEAELYESGVATHFAGAEGTVGGHPHEGDEAEGHAHEPAEADLTRDLLTVLITVLAACGFGLILVAGFALAERFGLTRVDVKIGLLFGLAGFAGTQLMPSLGLSPELPGAAAGALADRQVWWMGTVLATLGGIALIAFGSPVLKAAGVMLIAVPHVIGAPHPEAFEGVVPPELSALFAARVLVVGALGWAVLGALAGHFWSRETAT
ncbi:MAG: CbtA family protein [Paracoccaceae bacterium]|nr:CbtA family protein [Paracoccaceae bacterium]